METLIAYGLVPLLIGDTAISIEVPTTFIALELLHVDKITVIYYHLTRLVKLSLIDKESKGNFWLSFLIADSDCFLYAHAKDQVGIDKDIVIPFIFIAVDIVHEAVLAVVLLVNIVLKLLVTHIWHYFEDPCILFLVNDSNWVASHF